MSHHSGSTGAQGIRGFCLDLINEAESRAAGNKSTICLFNVCVKFPSSREEKEDGHQHASSWPASANLLISSNGFNMWWEQQAATFNPHCEWMNDRISGNSIKSSSQAAAADSASACLHLPIREDAAGREIHSDSRRSVRTLKLHWVVRYG